MSTSETTITTNTEGGDQEPSDPTVVVAGGTNDQSALGVDLGKSMERLNSLEAQFGNVQGEVASKADAGEFASFKEQMTSSFGELVTGIKEALSGITETVKSPVESVVEEAPKPDSAPTSKEHPFWRSWSRKS